MHASFSVSTENPQKKETHHSIYAKSIFTTTQKKKEGINREKEMKYKGCKRKRSTKYGPGSDREEARGREEGKRGEENRIDELNERMYG